MKRTRTTTYSRGVVGLTDVAVALLFVSLWVVWPAGQYDGPKRAIRTPVGIAYSKSVQPDRKALDQPDLFIVPSVPGPDSGADVRVPPELTVPASMQPRLLERPDCAATASGDASPPGASLEFAAPERYEPSWEHRETFVRPAGTGPKLSFAVDGELRESGFLLPELQMLDGKGGAKPWMATFSVLLSDDGRVEQVWLESGTDDAKLNGLLLRAVGRGRAERPGARRQGRVTLNYGVP